MSAVATRARAASVRDDQAAGLRSLFKPRALRILPVLPAGDANAQGAASALLARELAASGRQVILLDETGAAARPLSVKPRHDLASLIQGENEFAEVAVRASPGLRYVAASEGLPMLIGADAAGEQFFGGFLNLDEPADTLVLNLAGTLTPNGQLWLPALMASAAHLLVAGIGDNDLTAAYAAIKQAQTGAGNAPAFRLLVSGAGSEKAARAVCAKISQAAQRFLSVRVEYAGNVPPTASGVLLGGSLAAQNYPEAVGALKRLAQEAASWRLAECIAGESDGVVLN